MTFTSGWSIGMHDAMMMVEPSTLDEHFNQRSSFPQSLSSEVSALPCPNDQIRGVICGLVSVS